MKATNCKCFVNGVEVDTTGSIEINRAPGLSLRGVVGLPANKNTTFVIPDHYVVVAFKHAGLKRDIGSVIHALKLMREDICTEHPRLNKRFGICWHMREIYKVDFEFSLLYFSWPLWNHNSAYPVDGYDEDEFYGRLYEGRGLYLRLSLINHMINKLEELKQLHPRCDYSLNRKKISGIKI